MKKLLIALLALMLCFIACAETTITTEDDSYTVNSYDSYRIMYVNAKAGLNMREKADFSSAKIITLWLGEPVYVMETKNGFAHIMCQYGEGYVAESNLSYTRSKNMELYEKMYVSLKTAGEKLNVRPVPYLPKEYPNDPVDMIANGTYVTAINQYGSFVEIIYFDSYGQMKSGFVAESCLTKCADAAEYKDEVCFYCKGKLDGRCHLITEEEGRIYLVCNRCYNVGTCHVCNKYVYFDHAYVIENSKPIHFWCNTNPVANIFKYCNPFA